MVLYYYFFLRDPVNCIGYTPFCVVDDFAEEEAWRCVRPLLGWGHLADDPIYQTCVFLSGWAVST